jgi:hypothetical protein
MLPIILRQCTDVGLRLDKIKEAMAAIGYNRASLHQLDR